MNNANTAELKRAVMVRSDPVLTIQNLVKRRERADVAFELHVPEFRLLPGEFVAIVGASGCGKSTLLDILALVLQPTSCARFELHVEDGSVDIGGLWRANAESGLAELRATRLGYVLQTGGLLPFLTVRQNLLLPSRIAHRGGADERLALWSKRIGIDGWLEMKPQYLSGGQRQRAAILRGMLHEPSIVYADEPTAAVDQERATNIVADFRTLARDNGVTIVMVTHDRDLALPVADRVYGFDVETRSETETRSRCLLVQGSDVSPTPLGGAR